MECRGLDNPPEFLAVTAEGIRANGQQELVGFDKVAATYWKTALECGAREALLLTEEIKQRRQGLRDPLAGVRSLMCSSLSLRMVLVILGVS